MRRRAAPLLLVLGLAPATVTLARVQTIASGPISTQATVEITDTHDKPIGLQPQEKIAVMFLSAISSMENDCHNHLRRLCPLEELVQGVASPDWHIGKLKYDPARDPSYRYVVTISTRGWQARADPQRAGLGGLLFDGSTLMVRYYYNDAGPATPQSRSFTGISIDGEIFNVR